MCGFEEEEEEGKRGQEAMGTRQTARGMFSLYLCHKGHPGYRRCVWERIQSELLIVLSTPTVYSPALAATSHPEENYTGTGHAKGHTVMEIEQLAAGSAYLFGVLMDLRRITKPIHIFTPPFNLKQPLLVVMLTPS